MFKVKIQINDDTMDEWWMLNVTKEEGGTYAKGYQTYRIYHNKELTDKYFKCMYGDWKPLFNHVAKIINREVKQELQSDF